MMGISGPQLQAAIPVSFHMEFDCGWGCIMSKMPQVTPRTARQAAWRIACIYAVVSAVYILFSDYLLALLVQAPSELAFYSMIKGWSFVLITALLLYLLVRSYTSQLERRALHLEAAQRQAQANALARQHLLRELDHRVKNNLANLFSLVSLYERQASDQSALAELIRNKILALKRTHEALAINHFAGLDVRRLALAMADAGTSWDNIAPRLHLNIPELHVTLRQAPALAMVFHELFTHARQYGALSTPTGKVTLDVDVLVTNADGTRARIAWSETGGSSVLGATHHPHQGLAIIEGLTRFELAGSATIHSSEHGFSCTLVVQFDPPSDESDDDLEPADTSTVRS